MEGDGTGTSRDWSSVDFLLPVRSRHSRAKTSGTQDPVDRHVLVRLPVSADSWVVCVQ